MAEEPPDRAHQLGRALLLHAGPGADHAVLGMVLEQAQGDLVEGGLDRRDLGDDVDAVALLFDHPPDPADLALDPAQPLEQRLLVARVGGGLFAAPAISRSLGHQDAGAEDEADGGDVADEPDRGPAVDAGLVDHACPCRGRSGSG